MKRRTTAAEWAVRIRAWRASGQSAEQFAQTIGCSSQTLVWWKSELSRRERRAPRVALARVIPAMAVSAISRPLVIAVGDARIEVRAGFDKSLLRDVVDALGAAR